ncbi:hypothetical protein P171DRAFT_431775 [Karstenula rhodostoma CBS 690.94]|uniref:Uncharacterized protein n=1 Tax=Karstenula rhodostoma CBS 690.94 TaxID=1392251 RepID=A0A9P4PLF8_9PLEO|nr:hypothetical protein P171DRAFT_431775 [Karstenula rhodostoma CBS 690.94]
MQIIVRPSRRFRLSASSPETGQPACLHFQSLLASPCVQFLPRYPMIYPLCAFNFSTLNVPPSVRRALDLRTLGLVCRSKARRLIGLSLRITFSSTNILMTYFRPPERMVSITPPTPTVSMAIQTTSAPRLPSVSTTRNLNASDGIRGLHSYQVYGWLR